MSRDLGGGRQLSTRKKRFKFRGIRASINVRVTGAGFFVTKYDSRKEILDTATKNFRFCYSFSRIPVVFTFSIGFKALASALRCLGSQK